MSDAERSDSAHAPTRREFCSYACHAATLLASGALTACSTPTSPSSSSAPPLPSATATVNGRVVTVTVDSGALAGTGGAAIAQTALGAFLISRNGPQGFTVLTAVCTHESCTVSGFANNQYVCPCHGSRFSTSGAVANGPASRPLREFPAQVSGNTLSFTA